MDGTSAWVLACFAAFLVGLGKGGVPVVTAMSVPLMSLMMSPVVAAGILLPVFIVSDVFGVFAYRKTYHPKVLKIMLIALPIGVTIGYFTASSIPDDGILVVIGLIGGWFALNTILRKPIGEEKREPRVKRGLFWGTISGFTSFVSHSGATAFQVYALPLGLDKITFAGTMAIAFGYINVIKLIPYYALGELSVANLQAAFSLLVPAVVGVFVGVRVVRAIPQKLFFRVIVWALLLLSLRLLWAGITGLLG